MELLKRFDNGKTLKELHPIDDMEIEFDEETDEMDIVELIEAKDKVHEEIGKPIFKNISEA